MKTLPNDILLAMAKYYYHRSFYKKVKIQESKAIVAQVFGLTYTYGSYEDEKANQYKEKADKWNKEEDLDAISKIADKHKFVFAACAGTFWFTRRTSTKFFVQFKCDEDNYLDSGTRTIEKTK